MFKKPKRVENLTGRKIWQCCRISLSEWPLYGQSAKQRLWKINLYCAIRRWRRRGAFLNLKCNGESESASSRSPRCICNLQPPNHRTPTPRTLLMKMIMKWAGAKYKPITTSLLLYQLPSPGCHPANSQSAIRSFYKLLSTRRCRMHLWDSFWGQLEIP